jgi:hypothetical protein
MSTTTTRKSSPAVTLLLVILALFIGIGGGLLAFKAADPEDFNYLLHGSPSTYYSGQLNQSQAQLAATQGNLTAAQRTIGTLQGELAAARLKPYAWPILIFLLVLLAVAIYFLAKWARRKRGLTLREAIHKYEPIVRSQYVFDKERYPYAPVIRKASFERIKRKDVKDPDAFIYFIEYFFCDAMDQSRYLKGVRPARDRTVTVQLLNINDEYRQRDWPWTLIEEAIAQSHENELWGYAMQKTKTEDDVLAALQQSKNIDEVKKQYAEPEADT